MILTPNGNGTSSSNSSSNSDGNWNSNGNSNRESVPGPPVQGHALTFSILGGGCNFASKDFYHIRRSKIAVLFPIPLIPSYVSTH